MENKDENSGWGWIIFIIIVLVILSGPNSKPSTETPTVQQNPQTWQQFTDISSDDVLAQLVNTQNLITALGNDISHLETQNVDLHTALSVVQNQLFFAQLQAEEDSKRQSKEQWITTVAGTIVGWLLGILVPTKQTLSKGWNFVSKPFGQVNARSDPKNTTKATFLHKTKINWFKIIFIVLIIFILFDIVLLFQYLQ